MKTQAEPKTKNLWISLDLEMNQDADGGLDDIIQIGAVIFDVNTGVLRDKLNILVQLPLDENNNKKTLTPFISNLTGITQDMLDKQGKSLWLAYLELVDFVERHDAHTEPVCWGGNDAQYLLRELSKKKAFTEQSGKYLFTSNYFDCKKFFQAYCIANGQAMKSGLAKSMRRVNLTFKGRVHDAHDDAKNCAEMFVFLKNKFKNT